MLDTQLASWTRMPSTMPSWSGSPVVIGTSLTAAVQAGRLLSASICVVSMKIVSLRIQLPPRTVRSSIAALPTLLKSGWVSVTSGVQDGSSTLRRNLRTF
jgi:hypothetical protein